MSRTNAQASTTYQRGRADVLRAVFVDGGDVTINDLAEISGLSRPTVSRAVADLSDRGFLTPGDDALPALGRPAKTVRIGRANDAVLGFQVERGVVGTFLMDLTGNLLGHVAMPYDERRTGPEALDQWFTMLGATVDSVLARAGVGRDRVRAAAFGISGLVDADGVVKLSHFLPLLSGVPLRERAIETLDLDVVLVDNDMTLRAMGEKLVGAGRDYEDFVYFTFDGEFKPSLSSTVAHAAAPTAPQVRMPASRPTSNTTGNASLSSTSRARSTRASWARSGSISCCTRSLPSSTGSPSRSIRRLRSSVADGSAPARNRSPVFRSWWLACCRSVKRPLCWRVGTARTSK